MIKARQHVANFTLLGLAIAMTSSPSFAQDAERPDLSGLWTHASLTSIGRRASTNWW